MFILFRCTAGANNGWGNLKRLELIFKFLKNKFNFNYKFLINKNKYIEKYLKKKKINYFLVSKNLAKEKKIISNFEKIDISILELLNCNLNIQKIYKEVSKKLIILDDITKKKYISDILISCQKKFFKPKKINSCEFYNDYTYFPLKKTFNKFISKNKTTKKDIKQIIVFLGGSNYLKFYIKIAKKLKNQKFQVSFLIGPENSYKINKEIKSISKKFKVFIDSNLIAKKIFNSDLVISCGGYTKIETAYLKTPMICIPIHNHQKILIRDFYKSFNLKINYSNLLLKNNLIHELQKFNYFKRLNISKKFSTTFKVNGIKKIADLIYEK